jgi:hypothetical protein
MISVERWLREAGWFWALPIMPIGNAWPRKKYEKVVPDGYAHEHISHYTRKELIDTFKKRSFTLEATRYILRGELILVFRKPQAGRQ